jgi:hypothetical protein
MAGIIAVPLQFSNRVVYTFSSVKGYNTAFIRLPGTGDFDIIINIIKMRSNNID